MQLLFHDAWVFAGEDRLHSFNDQGFEEYLGGGSCFELSCHGGKENIGENGPIKGGQQCEGGIDLKPYG